VQPFEYVMALISVVVGLGITHILVAMGEIVHRLRGHGPPIKLDAVYFLWVGFILTWLVTIWWAEYKFHQIDFVWTFGGYLQLVTYMISLFVVTVILVPARMDHVADTYAFFVDGRRWFFGALFVATVLDFFDTLMKGADWAFRLEYLVSQTGLIAVICIIGWFTASRAAHLTMAAGAFAAQIIYNFLALNILGRW
jgi:hypothetical protein